MMPLMTSVLISAADLARQFASVTVLDVRYRMGGPGGRTEFEAGHVPGAAYVDLDSDLADEPGERGRHPLPATEKFQSAMRRVGVTDDRPVVVYDDWEGRAAARCWWLLRFHGHPDVRVLDGGWASWRSSGGGVERGPVVPAPGGFTAVPGNLPVLAAEDLAGLVASGTLIDARNPERYNGETEPVDPVAGHVPGAVNVPTGTNLRADGRFRSADELRALYAAAGVVDGAPVGAYCGSGVTAAHDVLALTIAGIDVALYPGSWSEWVTDPARPVATGPQR